MRGVLLALGLWATPAAAVTCDDVVFDGVSFTICEVDPAVEDLRLFHSGADGAALGQFQNVEAAFGRALAFAMNAGMYHPDRAPVGHYVEERQVLGALVTRAGPGNFGLLPNGVFCIEETRARVLETLAYAANPPSCQFATQSGPMLVIDGVLHPRLLPDGASKFIRNGVGTSADGARAVFAISNEPVNFHTFARLFRDALSVPDALYFDGKISRLYAPALGRHDRGFDLGVMVGVWRE